MSVPASMTWIWWAVPAIVAILGALLFISGLGKFFDGRPFSGSQGLVGGLAFLGLGLAGSLLGLNIQTYSRLTYERPVASVAVKAADPANKLYNVTVTRLDGASQEKACQVQGDEWIMGARVQKWQPWANVLGLDATYDLDQMANKYYNAAEANGKPITACDLTLGKPEVNQYVPQGLTAWLLSLVQVEDRRFGSANYMPLADGATYNVVMTQSGLNSEPANETARKAYDAPH
ncbi:MAG TPA: hypothetical protein VG735_02085 [Caulobacterales bacterium]|nr:hypothetical protein [Caulobacterales bacterium]